MSPKGFRDICLVFLLCSRSYKLTAESLRSFFECTIFSRSNDTLSVIVCVPFRVFSRYQAIALALAVTLFPTTALLTGNFGETNIP